MVGRRLGCKTVLADSDLPLVQQQLLASFEATEAAATEASRLLATNPSIDGTGLAGAISTLLKTQQTLFEVIQQLLQSVELELTPPDAASITPTEPDSAPVEWARSMDVMSVTSIGEFPDDWGDPQEWVEAPRGRVFRRRADKSQARADRRPA